ncbi:MAG: DNA alkylation repair protein [Pseudomonadota bacterium]
MSSLLKDIYNQDFYAPICEALEELLPDFDRNQFLKQIFCETFKSMELKQRMSHSINIIATCLPSDYPTAVTLLENLIDRLRAKQVREQSFEYMFLPEFIETHGIDDLETSLSALEYITQFTSCEFAVRPFIHRYGETVLQRMQRWAEHPHPMVRRLASEGARPRLPWAMALPQLKQDPGPLMAILEKLKQDESDSVRRSVANNLNDISKDNPEFTIAVVKRWQGVHEKTDALLKHACRSLLKQGNPEILELFGYQSQGVEIVNFKLASTRVKFGEAIEFSFGIHNRSARPRKLRIEYAIHHLKKNGQLTAKVFHISERELEGASSTDIVRRHQFKPITTRRYYPGGHQVSVIVNGLESAPLDFELVIVSD